MPTSVPRWSDPVAFESDDADELPPEIVADLERANRAGSEELPLGRARKDIPDLATLMEVAVAAVGGVPREGQAQMAEAVEHTITTGEHLAVQAGTGTGKSLAYLVPAIRHAVADGTTVVVTRPSSPASTYISKHSPGSSVSSSSRPRSIACAAACATSSAMPSACRRS